MPRTRSKPQPVPSVPPADNGSQPPLEPEVLTLAEAAAYLRLPESEIVRAVREQGLSARQVGGEWRFLKSAIHDWLRTGPATQQKEGIWSLFGKGKDDPHLMEICREAYRQRGRPMTEDE